MTTAIDDPASAYWGTLSIDVPSLCDPIPLSRSKKTLRGVWCVRGGPGYSGK
jgi:hypothetical protein